MVKKCIWCGDSIPENHEICITCNRAYIKGHSDGRKDILEISKERYKEYDLEIARLKGQIEILERQLANSRTG